MCGRFASSYESVLQRRGQVLHVLALRDGAPAPAAGLRGAGGERGGRGERGDERKTKKDSHEGSSERRRAVERGQRSRVLRMDTSPTEPLDCRHEDALSTRAAARVQPRAGTSRAVSALGVPIEAPAACEEPRPPGNAATFAAHRPRYHAASRRRRLRERTPPMALKLGLQLGYWQRAAARRTSSSSRRRPSGSATTRCGPPRPGAPTPSRRSPGSARTPRGSSSAPAIVQISARTPAVDRDARAHARPPLAAGA